MMNFQHKKIRNLEKMRRDSENEYNDTTTKLIETLNISRRSFEFVFKGKSISEIRASLPERSERRKRKMLEEIKPTFKPSLCEKSLKIFDRTHQHSLPEFKEL